MRSGTDRDVEFTSGSESLKPRGDSKARAHADERGVRYRVSMAERARRGSCGPRVSGATAHGHRKCGQMVADGTDPTTPRVKHPMG